MSPLAKFCLPIFVGLLAFCLWPSRKPILAGGRLTVGDNSQIGGCDLRLQEGTCSPQATYALHFGGGFYFLEQSLLVADKPTRVEALTYDLNRSIPYINGYYFYEYFNALQALLCGLVLVLAVGVIEKKYISTVTPTWFKKRNNSKKK